MNMFMGVRRFSLSASTFRRFRSRDARLRKPETPRLGFFLPVLTRYRVFPKYFRNARARPVTSGETPTTLRTRSKRRHGAFVQTKRKALYTTIRASARTLPTSRFYYARVIYTNVHTIYVAINFS